MAFRRDFESDGNGLQINFVIYGRTGQKLKTEIHLLLKCPLVRVFNLTLDHSSNGKQNTLCALMLDDDRYKGDNNYLNFLIVPLYKLENIHGNSSNISFCSCLVTTKCPLPDLNNSPIPHRFCDPKNHQKVIPCFQDSSTKAKRKGIMQFGKGQPPRFQSNSKPVFQYSTGASPDHSCIPRQLDGEL
ncbi:hypothetical protein CEXT_225861 [Caerostris extrusa]|uniref:Uncharacterized protein n=1 Tax=Caerostris extrusa TaxID=172846 RepID=A0AAV4UPD6_CAEEX|nr:hypothetical protein CEXT_225861 [Caerostris extrusa]